MARADRFITETREDVVRIIDLVEQAQAIAASRLQEYNAISDKETLEEEFDWEAVEMELSDFRKGMKELEKFGDLLGDGAVDLYRFKIELS